MELGFTPEQVPDVLIEIVILAVRRAEALKEERESARKVQQDEAANRDENIA